mmetsp:Transcript_1056/g.1508  ORF Transcript_1056/g.1508 Transcript_1056/m.1508 type:complete len:96 (-) Transcript_1056:1904-2191(-)
MATSSVSIGRRGSSVAMKKRKNEETSASVRKIIVKKERGDNSDSECRWLEKATSIVKFAPTTIGVHPYCLGKEKYMSWKQEQIANDYQAYVEFVW